MQQRQARVRATGAVAGQAVNDNGALESEADRMGARAQAMSPSETPPIPPVPQAQAALQQAAPLQRMRIWRGGVPFEVEDDYILKPGESSTDPALSLPKPTGMGGISFTMKLPSKPLTLSSAPQKSKPAMFADEEDAPTPVPVSAHTGKKMYLPPRMPAYVPPASDSESSEDEDGTTKLYHGGAGRQRGRFSIDVTKGRQQLDFNPAGQHAFYTTKDKRQAQEWAMRRAGSGGDPPALHSFKVKNEDMGRLDHKEYASPVGEDWKRRVVSNRGGDRSASPHGIISGPMLGNPMEVEKGLSPRAIPNSQQTAFLSGGAVRLLDAGYRGTRTQAPDRRWGYVRGTRPGEREPEPERKERPERRRSPVRRSPVRRSPVRRSPEPKARHRDLRSPDRTRDRYDRDRYDRDRYDRDRRDPDRRDRNRDDDRSRAKGRSRNDRSRSRSRDRDEASSLKRRRSRSPEDDRRRY